MASALGLGIFLFARDAGKYIAPRLKLTYEQGFQKTFDLGVWVIVCSILGARLFYVLENREQFRGAMGFFDTFKIWEGGLVFYGGLFGGAIVGFWWVRSEKWPLSYTFDLVAPYILLGHAIGRVGCFLNGCCYGIVDDHWGMVFPGGEDSLPHLPTQLWEMAGDLALFFILLAVRRWTIRYSWLTLALYGLTYGLLRYVIEFWRRSWDKKYLIVFNSASQAISAVIFLISVIVIMRILSSGRKVKQNSPD